MSYFAYGLCIESEIPLSGISSAIGLGNLSLPDVVIRRGAVAIANDSGEQHFFEPRTQSAVFHWERIGNFWVHEGREIIVDAARSVADDLLRSVLLGPIFAMLLFQRGFLVLHASAVALNDPRGAPGAVGFLGHSRQGKSTMAAALLKRNHQPLADDTIAVPVLPPPVLREGQQRHELLLIHPALPHLKLRSPSVEALGEQQSSLSLWRPDEDGYVLPLPDPLLQPAPLRCLYLLEEGQGIEIEKLAPEAALMTVLDNAFCIRALPDWQAGNDFLHCAELVRHVPVFRLARPKSYESLLAVAIAVENHYINLPEED